MKHLIFIALLVLIIIITSLPIIFTSNNNSKIAEIYCNNSLLYSIDLSKVTTQYEIPILNDNKSNIVLVEKNKISMKSSNCPDGLCVMQGGISSSFLPIVCLPNNIVIKIVNNNVGDIDAVSR